MSSTWRDCPQHDGATESSWLSAASGVITNGRYCGQTGCQQRASLNTATSDVHVWQCRPNSALISCFNPCVRLQDTALGDRSFAKRQILRYDHGYAVESLPAPLASVPLPAATSEATAAARPAEGLARPDCDADRSVPRWVANDRKVRGIGGRLHSVCMLSSQDVTMACRNRGWATCVCYTSASPDLLTVFRASNSKLLPLKCKCRGIAFISG